MAKYNMDKSGLVFRHTTMPNDTPVIVLPEADWKRMMELLDMERHANINPWPEIDGIIQRTEAENGQ